VALSSVALVVGHPGHELRLHHWIEIHRPLVFVLTDGGGHAARPRIASTTRLIERTGATPAGGAFYGAFGDRELYDALLGADDSRFVALAAHLAHRLDDAGCTTVAGDAAEGYNPGHDVCRILIDAAVERRRRSGQPLLNLAFPLVAHPGATFGGQPPAVALELDAAALERKLAAARDYLEMQEEVERALARYGAAAFATEALWNVEPNRVASSHDEAPFYETHGSLRVREGHYRETIRHHNHMLPVARALRDWAAASP